MAVRKKNEQQPAIRSRQQGNTTRGPAQQTHRGTGSRRQASGNYGTRASAARHLESGESLTWNTGNGFGTDCMIKVAIYDAVFRRARVGQFSLSDEVTVRNAGAQHAGLTFPV